MFVMVAAIYLLISSCDSITPLPSLKGADPETAIVTFVVPMGQGDAPWNTESTPLKVKVGQTLRIKNFDTTRQTLHTGGEPCPHGGNRLFDANGKILKEGFNVESIPVGGWLECDIKSVPANELFLYNHFGGPSARVFLEISTLN